MAANTNIPSGVILPPVQVFTCDVSPTYTPEDNETYINKTIIQVVECEDIPLSSEKDAWNCSLCGGDQPYAQPVIDGDVFNLQYIINNNTVKKYSLYIYDNNDVLVEDTGSELIETTDSQGNHYLTVRLTISNIPAQCFYFKILAFNCVIADGEIDDCVEARLLDGYGPKEAELFCLLQVCEDLTGFYSEMYRKTTADCEDTLLIKGVYNFYDCNGNFYGQPEEDEDPFEFQIRVPGTIEKTEFDFEETEVFNTRRSSKKTDTYLFRTYKIPPYVAEQMAVIFNSQTVLIDGVQYKGGRKLAKNNEEGRMWIINTTLQIECDEIDFTCEN